MYAVSTTPVRYVSAEAAMAPQRAVGCAFARAWHERSAASGRQLRTAIARFADRLRADRVAPETAVIRFKQAVHQFGGMHAHPGLALEHQADGEDCAAVYAEAFTIFVNALFPLARPR